MMAQKIQTLGNRPIERIQHSQHDESLKSRMSSKLALFIATHTQRSQGVNHITLCYLNWWPGSLVFRPDVHCLTLTVWLLLYTSAVCCRKKVNSNHHAAPFI
jgi:hypothetical protein